MESVTGSRDWCFEQSDFGAFWCFVSEKIIGKTFSWTHVLSGRHPGRHPTVGSFLLWFDLCLAVLWSVHRKP